MDSGDPGFSFQQLVDYNLDTILQIRTDKLDMGFPYSGHNYDSTLQERNNIIGCCTLALATIIQGGTFPANFTWRTQENINQPFTAPQIIQLGTAMFTFISTCYQVSWAHKQAVLAFTPDQIEQLRAYDLYVYWPTTGIGSTGDQ